MDVTIDSCMLGAQKHLVVSDDGVSWSHRVVSDSWHFSGGLKQTGNKCWDTMLKLSHTSTPKIPEKYVAAMALVAPNETKIPWRFVVPQTVYKQYFDEILSLARKPIDDAILKYYTDVWLPGDQLLNSLRPARTDGQQVEQAIESSVHSSTTVSTFRPRSGGFAQPVVYTRFGTVTGRLVVESGPNILHLKKEHRSIIKPSTSGGKIVSIDFSSLEARILLYETGGACDESDLYTSIGEQLGGIPRKIVKGAILAELYGSSRNSLALSLGLSDTALSQFIKRIGEVIDTRPLLSKIKAQFAMCGYITNKHGRRIEVTRPQDNIFINYYAQSTGVDVALYGFNKIINDIGVDGIRPLFVLHDALILDVRNDRLQDVCEVKRVSVPGYSQNFPVKVEIL
jgi:hypothetical protein